MRNEMNRLNFDDFVREYVELELDEEAYVMPVLEDEDDEDNE